ncbi:MAG: tetratricopeptide repeat protein [Candidatus Aminicenantes bacterium]|nr:tetratricopeptide repeat protein [Candidatus Aminicenantes bacterium]
MIGRTAKLIILVILVLAVIFFSTSCEKLKPSNLMANNHFSAGNHHFADGLYRQAIEEYEQALGLNPDLGDIYRYLGEAYKNIYRPGIDTPENIEKADKALEALRKAYELYPNNKEVIYSLGDMYDKLREFDEAEKLYLKILEMEPGNMDNYYVVAEFYKRYAKGTEEEEREETGVKTPYEKAEEMYLRRIEADPENPQGYSYAARFYELLEPIPDFDRANYFHEKRILLQPDSAEAWLSKGVNRWAKAYRLPELSKEERLESAYDGLSALEKAAELDPDYPEPYSWLSVIYQSVLAQLEPEKASRHKAEGQKNSARFQELRKREAERRRLEEELRKGE